MDSPRSTIETVGPLFSAGLTSDHTCTASVVDSPAGDVIVTAAHCISGSGAGVVFAPGYDDGLAPYGTWVVQRAYAAPGWTIGRDPDADYIFLIVTPATTNRTSASVQAVVGGNVLGGSPTAGQQVTVAGYVSGHDDVPVICTASIYLTASYPSFDCPGYAGGTSGAPWIADYDPSTGTGTVTAVIGGLRQGGCSPGTSFSPPFTSTVSQVFARAVTAAAADDIPSPGPDGC